MRISVREGAPGYIDPFPFGKVKIILDGKDITECCQDADEELGKVRVLKYNEDGKRYYDPEIDEAAYKVLRGKVEIVLDS